MDRSEAGSPDAYAGYRDRAGPAEDSELTHVGPATPAGEYLRTAW